MTLIENLMGEILKKIDDIKGPRELSVIKVKNSAEEGYVATTSDGNQIRLICSEVTYKVTFEKRWVRNKKISIYTVYCTFSPGMPQEVKDKLSGQFTIAQLLHYLSFREEQKKAAIHAYMDVVLAKYLT